MKLNWIEDLLAIVETGSLSKAAERRNLTQPAFSRRIRAIEHVLGVELIDRSKKPTQLLPGVLAHREQFAQLDSDLQQLIADLRYGSLVEQNQLAIASQHSLTTVFAPRLIYHLQQGANGLSVELVSENLDECIGSLLARRADLALIYRHHDDQDMVIEADFVESHIVSSDRLIPVYGGENWQHLASIERLPIISYPNTVYFGRIFSRAILPQLRATYSTDLRVQTSLTLAALELAENGSGIAWIPESVGKARIQSGAITDLSDRLPSCALNVVALKLIDNSRVALATAWQALARLQGGGF